MTRLQSNQILIYSAGKTWHAPLFREMRDNLGYNIVATWIDFGCSVNDLLPEHRFSLWNNILLDMRKADVSIMYCQDMAEEQSGAIAEIGAMIIQGKPVYCIGTCVSLEPIPTSDRAFTQSDLFHFTEANTIRAGYREALAHYKRHYYLDWQRTRDGKTIPITDPSMTPEEISAIGASLAKVAA